MKNLAAPFLRLFLPIAAVILIFAYLYIDHTRQTRLAELQANESLNIRLGAAVLERHAQGVLQDLKYLTRHNAFHASVMAPAVPDTAELVRDFVDFLVTHPVYDQMRWIDASGRERVRVDLQDGRPVVISGDNLQNKGDRYYFTETMQLDPGQVYISPLDLNIERGQVSVPHKPSLRLAMPVAEPRGEKRGMIILNFLAGTMIEQLKAVTPTALDRLMLLNADGYFIVAPDPADEWAFMFDDHKRSLAVRYPESWGRIDRADAGQFIDGDGLWTFRTVSPRKAINDTGLLDNGSAAGDMRGEAARRWHVATRIPAEQLNMILNQGVVQKLGMVAGLLLLAALGSLAVARATVRERDAEQRFRMYFEYAKVGMGVSSPDKRWLAVNPTLCQILKYSAAELLNRSWAEMTHPDDLDANVSLFDSVLRGEAEGYTLEKRFLGADGQAVDVAIAAQVVRKRDGSADYFIVVIEDISRRVRAEKEHQNSLETLRRFLDHFPGVAYIKDDQARVLFVSQQVRKFLGQGPETLVGRTSDEVFAGDLGRRAIAADRRIIASGQAEVIQEVFGGHSFETIKFPIPHGNEPPSLGAISIDITERRRSEEKLALLARRSTALLALPAMSRQLDEKTFMAYVLDLAEELTGSQIGFMHFVNPDQQSIELAAWSTRTLSEYCHAAFDSHYPISQAGIWADAARLKKPVVINDYAAVARPGALPDGHSVLQRLISVPVMEGEMVRMMTGVGNKADIYDDSDVETLQLLGSEAWRIVSQQRAVKALELANQVVVASPVVCFRWAATEGWPVVFVSDNVSRWGYTAEQLRSGTPVFADLIHPDDRSRVVAEVAAKTAAGFCDYEQEYRLLTRENKAIWIVDRTTVRRDAEGHALYFDGVLTDITDRKAQQLALAATLAEQKTLNKRLEEAHNQLLQSEKMASIGQLAAGVAHELNNPIGFVHSNLGTLDGYVRDLMDIIAAYDALLESGTVDTQAAGKLRLLKEERDFGYIAEDIGSLLNESKDGLARVRKIVLDLKNFSHAGEQEWQEADLHQGLDSTLNIVWNELKYKCKVVKEYADLPKVSCMISQLNQVFMNLLVNAGHAIETQGTITIRTSLLADDCVSVEIGDTGKGIPAEILSRIFEPFFTTKPVGKGTGLGLSLAYGIIEKHRGRIEVDSTPGQGTVFRIILPINQDTGPAGSQPETAA